MADKRRQQKQAASAGRPQQGQSSNRPEKSKEELLREKVEKAKSPEYALVTRRALDTSEFITLINYQDNLVTQLRKRSGPGRRISFKEVEDLLVRGNILKALLNEHNAEMCSIMNWRYESPRNIDRLLDEVTTDQLDAFRKTFDAKLRSMYPKQKSEGKPPRQTAPQAAPPQAEPQTAKQVVQATATA